MGMEKDEYEETCLAVGGLNNETCIVFYKTNSLLFWKDSLY